ncbi:MAG: NUDIX domain-containing protein [Paracoccaceae bacterium]
MNYRPTRLAVRAILVHQGRLLLVNAYPGGRSDLWCAPGGGVHPGQSLPDNLVREVQEETGLTITPGPLVLVNEFHDPDHGFHQVELFFRAHCSSGLLPAGWKDSAGVVTERRFFAQEELAGIRLKPDSLPRLAFEDTGGAHYDPLERIAP